MTFRHGLATLARGRGGNQEQGHHERDGEGAWLSLSLHPAEARRRSRRVSAADAAAQRSGGGEGRRRIGRWGTGPQRGGGPALAQRWEPGRRGQRKRRKAAAAALDEGERRWGR